MWYALGKCVCTVKYCMYRTDIINYICILICQVKISSFPSADTFCLQHYICLAHIIHDYIMTGMFLTSKNAI